MGNNSPVLVVSFGTSYHETCRKNIEAIEREIMSAYPDRAVHRAFTSRMVIRKLRERDGIFVDTVPQALEKLIRAGSGSVLIQPTHILNGLEYEGILSDAAPFRDRLSIAMGKPLLADTADFTELAAVLDSAFPPRENTAVCLMGHGTAHFSDAAYAALQYHLERRGRRDILVGTVEGFPDLDALRRELREYRPAHILLAPLMVVAGDHAVNDMAGEDGDSWKSALEAEGYQVRCVVKGLGEYPEIRAMYLRHVREALERLEKAI